MAFEHKKPGERWTPRAFELNAILDAGAAQAGAQGVKPGQGGGGWVTQPAVVRVKNNSGLDLNRYASGAIGDARWVMDRNSNIGETIFAFDAYTSGDAVAILQTPLKQGEIGFATVAGASLVEVTGDGTTANLYAAPNASGLLVPAATGPVQLLQARPTGGGVILALVNASGGSGLTGDEITDLRLSGNDLQYFTANDGWTTWHTATTC